MEIVRELHTCRVFGHFEGHRISCMATVLPAAATLSARRCKGLRHKPVPNMSKPTKSPSNLTAKLRAMDLALEQIELNQNLPSEASSVSQGKSAEPILSLVQDCVAKTAEKMETLQTAVWSHLQEETLSISQQGLDRQLATERKMTDFQVELTTALEHHLNDVELIFDRRVQQVRAELFQALAGIEAMTKEHNLSVSRLDGKMQEQIDQIERTLANECWHREEAAKTYADSRADVSNLQQQLELCQDALEFAKEQIQHCRHRTQQLQDNSDEFQTEFSLVKQRVQLLQEEVFSITPDLERRNQKLEDLLREQIGQVESKFAEAPSLRSCAAFAAGPLPALGKLGKQCDMQPANESNVRDIFQRLEEFQACWPGSLQAEHARLDEIRNIMEARFASAWVQVDFGFRPCLHELLV